MLASPHMAAAQQERATANPPFRDFLPAYCWSATKGFASREAWLAPEAKGAVADLQVDAREYRQIDVRGVPLWGPSVADSLRRCAAQLAPTTVSTATATRGLPLLDAARMQLGLGNDKTADTLIARFLAANGADAPYKPFVSDRAWALMQAASTYVLARPSRWAAGEQMLAELDHLPQASMQARFLAHSWTERAAFEAGDNPRRRREVKALYALWAEQPDIVPMAFNGELTDAIRDWANVLLQEQGAAPAKAAMDSAYARMASVGLANYMIVQAHVAYGALGTQAAPVQGTWWFHAPDSGHTAHPAPGKVTIVLSDHDQEYKWQYEAKPYRNFAILQQWLKRYESRGLELVTVMSTRGYLQDSVFATAEAEAEERRRYFLDVRQIPGMLTVYRSEFHQLPDRRWRQRPPPQWADYPFYMTIVNRKGTIVYVASMDDFRPDVLEAVIQRLLAE